jgi:hypothetical protein
MGVTCHAWLEDEDRSGAAAGIAAVADQMAGDVSGDNLQLSGSYPYIYAMYTITEFAAYPPVIMTLDGASFELPIITTKGIALNVNNDGQVYDFRRSPLKPPIISPAGENITATGYETDEAGVPHYLGHVLFVTDSPNVPVEQAAFPTHITRATVSAVSAAGAWETETLTLTDDLPAGRYALLGARVETATPCAARFILKGYADRPPVIPVSRNTDPVPAMSQWIGTTGYQFWYPGNLPQLEMLTMAAETPTDCELYLHQVQKGTPQG